jgi:hypothetical protein
MPHLEVDGGFATQPLAGKVFVFNLTARHPDCRLVYLKPVIIFAICSLSLHAEEPLSAPSARDVSTKIYRPGVNGVAGIIPKGAVLVSYGYSHEDPARGGTVNGLSAYYQLGLGHGLALFAASGHFISSGSRAGIGDTAIGLKGRIVAETRWTPLMSVAYSYKQPTAAAGIGSGYADHKLVWYADKNWGRTRLTANYAATFCGSAIGRNLVSVPSLGLLTPVRGRLGLAAQTYWSTVKAGYGGAILAPTWHAAPNCAFYAGALRNYGAGAARTGLVAGITWMHRPRL